MPRPMNPERAAALKSGARHYEGLPCDKGHTRRHVVSRACADCQAERQRARAKSAQPMSTNFDHLLG